MFESHPKKDEDHDGYYPVAATGDLDRGLAQHRSVSTHCSSGQEPVVLN